MNIVESTTYVAFDGKSFRTKDECEKHEQIIKEIQKEEYIYRFRLEAYAKPELFETKVCKTCNGSGEINSSIYFPDTDTCPDCYGVGRFEKDYRKSPLPEIPKDLMQHMSKAWNEYWEKIGPKGVYYERRKINE